MDEGATAAAPVADLCPELQLRCMGKVQLLDGRTGADLTPRTRKARALLAYLALTGRTCGRAQLADLLWSDRGEEQARGSLRQAIFELRHLKGAGWPPLHLEHDSIGIEKNRLDTDLAAVRRAAERSDCRGLAELLGSADPGLLTDLDGLDPEFDAWLQMERAHEPARTLAMALAAAEDCLRTEGPQAAREVVAAIQRLDPSNEEAARLSLLVDHRMGDRSALNRHFQLLRDRLQHDYDASPSPETEQLFHRLNNDSGDDGHARRAVVETPAPAPASGGASAGVRRKGRLPPLFAWALGALLAAAAVLFFVAGRSPAKTEGTISLAVLPFSNLSAGSGGRYLADGIGEEILGTLGRDPTIRLIGSTSARAVSEKGMKLRQIGEYLDVDYVLEGSVRAVPDRVRVNLRLLRTRDDTQLWTETFDRPAGDLFALQDEIGQAVAERLRGGAKAANIARAQPPKTSHEVYALYVTANGLARRRTYAAVVEAQRLLQRAVRLDPDYAPAHASLAMILELVAHLRPSAPNEYWPEQRALSFAHARRALALMPNLADAHVAIGMLESSTANLDRAQAAYAQAIELDPNNFMAWNGAGHIQKSLGSYARAVAHYRRAAAIEPLMKVPHMNVVMSLSAMGRYDEAQAAVRRAEAVLRDPVPVREMAAFVAFSRGDLSESMRLAQDALKSPTVHPITRDILASTYQALGLTEAAVDLVPEGQPLVAQYWKGNYAAAADLAEREAGDLWEMGSPPAAAAHALQRAGRQDVLLRLYDGRFPSVGSFDRTYRCEIAKIAAPLVMALRDAGRVAEANELLRAAELRHRQARAGGEQDYGMDVVAAELAMLRGNRDAALAGLERAVSRGWLDQWSPHGAGLGEPVFDAVRASPRFRKVAERMAQARDRERREALGRIGFKVPSPPIPVPTSAG